MSIHRQSPSLPSGSIDREAPPKWYDQWRWYAVGTPLEEKKLLVKLDFMILVFGCLTFFTKFLDLQAFQNAYVTGMKEDTGMKGNDLQYTTGVFQAGYCAAMIPANLLLTKIPPNIMIPIFEFAWGILTMCTAFVHTIDHIYAVRFLSGLFECVAYPGVIYCIGCWYKRSEISRRLSLFYIAGPLGSMFAGYFQTACYENLNGKAGLEGWRWLFIVCGCITMPVAILGLFVFPARPDSKNPSWLLSAEEIKLARHRVATEGSEAPQTKITGAVIKAVFQKWHWYMFVLLYVVFNQSMITYGSPFSLFLKAHPERYSISQINNLPTGQGAISIVTALVACYWADATGKRWLPALFICVPMAFGATAMAVWNIPLGLKMFSFYVVGLGNALNPLFMSWASEATFKSAEERALTVGSMNAFGQALLAGLNIVTFPTPKAPRFRFGWWWVMGSNYLQILVVLAILFLHEREKKAEGAVVLTGVPLERVESVEGKVIDMSKGKAADV